METTNEQLDRLLEFDPLDAAERITGTSYKEDEGVIGLGLALSLGHNEAKKAALRERGDTTMGDTVERYVSIIEGAGFECVLELPFEGTGYGEGGCEERLYVYACGDGLLLVFDTFNGECVNGSKLYYNLRTFEDGWSDAFSSGGFRDGIWVGDHDGREALFRKIERLSDIGEFLPQWVERPFLWLLHYMDTRSEGYDYKAINAERIAMLPEWVQEMVGDDE